MNRIEYCQIISDINTEIKCIDSSSKKQKTIIDHYEFIKEIKITGEVIYLYRIWIIENIKFQEDDTIMLKTPLVSMQAIVISIYDDQELIIKTNNKLTEDIYYLVRLFDPTFILEHLRDYFNENKFYSGLSRTITAKISDNNILSINDNSILPSVLNNSQKKSVLLAEKIDISLIWGPPGTGKTHTLSQIIKRSLEHKKRILVLSISNAAIDQIILYFDKIVSPDKKKHILRLGYTDNDICAQYINEISLSTNKNVIFSTLATAVTKNKNLNNFDLVVVDEASMVSLPYVFFCCINEFKKHNLCRGFSPIATNSA